MRAILDCRLLRKLLLIVFYISRTHRIVSWRANGEVEATGDDSGLLAMQKFSTFLAKNRKKLDGIRKER